MPVVKIFLDRFSKMVKADKKTVIERLPYIGLDIEGADENSIRVEYSPNRPDFSTDYGIARALNGVLGLKTGLPIYKVGNGRIQVAVDGKLSKIRPFVACLVSRNLKLDVEGIRQLISMQEDLHNGVGRKRSKAAIGFHDLDAVAPPIRYFAASSAFSFVPLGQLERMTAQDILQKTEQGMLYGDILRGTDGFPILQDSRGTVLSFPPIINGNQTKVSTNTKNIFVDVTSTEETVGHDILSIIASTLADVGGRLESVLIKYPHRSVRTPNLSPYSVHLDAELVRGVLGVQLSAQAISSCLRKSRLAAAGKKVLVPRYRIDILHPVDIAEEVALGYGVDKFEPLYPPSNEAGELNVLITNLDTLAAVAVSSGLIETISYELVDESSLFKSFDRSQEAKIEVEDPKSKDHSILRDSLIPPLVSVLSRNGKEDYPQRIFELGRIYKRNDSQGIESWHLCALIAHSGSTFSEAKMYLQGILQTAIGTEMETKSSEHWAFALGRSAVVTTQGNEIGHIGEVKASALAAFGISVPVSGFEIDLTRMLRA